MKRSLAFIMLLFYATAFPQIGRGVVTGRIRAADGRPAVGLRIAAMEIPEGNRAAVATSLLASITETDNDGKYRLEDLPPGRYHIVAGKLDTPTYYPGSKTAANAKAVSVTAGVTTAGIDFTATPPLRVTGRVIGLRIPSASPAVTISSSGLTLTLPAFNPGAGAVNSRVAASVGLTPVRSTNPDMILDAPVAPDGSFEFRDVQPGEYTIALSGSHPDYIVRIPGMSVAKVPTIVVAERDVTDVILAFPTHITGSVIVDQGGPAPSFFVTFTDPNASPIRVSASSAALVEAALPAGNYRVDVSGLAEGYFVKSIEYGSTDVLRAPLAVTDTSNLDSRLVVRLGISSPAPWARISGRVTGPGRPTGAGPLVFSVSSEALRLEFQSTVQPDGSFEFARVPMGTYQARFNPEPDGINPVVIAVGKSDLTGIEIPFPARVRVSGKVMVDAGAPLPGGRIRLTGTGARRVTGAAEVLAIQRDLSLAADGSFATVLPEGEYRMTMEGASSPYGVKSATDGTANLLTEPLRVTSSGAKELSVALSLMTFAVKGRVNSTGGSVPGLQVAISGTGLTATHYAAVGADGTFAFPKVPPGTYSVRVGEEGISIPVDLTAGAVSGIEFRLLRGKTIFPPEAAPPRLVLSFSNDARAVSSFVRPDIRADGTFEIAVPLGEFRGQLAGYLPQYGLLLIRNGKSVVINEGGEFAFSSRDELELQVIFQP